MKMNELTSHQKIKAKRCIFCGKKITNFQDFEYASTKLGRCTIYAFIHSDCIIEANEWIKKFDRNEKIGAVRYNIQNTENFQYADSDSVGRSEDDGK